MNWVENDLLCFCRFGAPKTKKEEKIQKYSKSECVKKLLKGVGQKWWESWRQNVNHKTKNLQKKSVKLTAKLGCPDPESSCPSLLGQRILDKIKLINFRGVNYQSYCLHYLKQWKCFSELIMPRFQARWKIFHF